MHRLTWKSPHGVKTWSVEDGLSFLPEEAAEALGTTAILTVGESARVVAPDLLLPLLPCRPLSSVRGRRNGEDLHLVWQPASRSRLQAISDEQTLGSYGSSSNADFRLVSEDGTEVDVGTTPVVVGRHPGCDVRLSDSRVSALHCVLHRVQGGVRILDLLSTNGTRVRGARLRDCVLNGRAVVSIGRSHLLLTPQANGQSHVDLPSPQMRRLDELVRRVADSDVPVLIQGESGVGKEAVAKRLHELSQRGGRLIALNAAAIVPSLAGSELFGHLRGAFTSANSDRIGAFVAAEGGTLFLDEIAELRLETQAELLRAVEQRIVQPVGSTRTVPVDVRVVSATNEDLAARVRAGAFREDLYHRLCVVPLTVPPLRERPEDAQALALAFLAQESPPRTLSENAWAKLRKHPWPGNIRELRNALQRACVLSDAPVLGSDDLQLTRAMPRTDRALDQIQERVLEVYSETGNSVAETAQRLGLHRTTVYRHLRDAREGRIRSLGRSSAAGR